MTDPGRPNSQTILMVILLLFLAALIPNLHSIIGR